MHYGHTHQDIIHFIYSISSQYNIDKKYILYSYFNHIIRHFPERINDRFMDMIDKIVHSTDTNIAELLNYFVYSVQSNKIETANLLDCTE